MIDLIYIEGNLRCFVYHSITRSWQDASVFCRNNKLNETAGWLAVDDTNQTHQILNSFFNKSGQWAWLGATTAPLYWNWAPNRTCK